MFGQALPVLVNEDTGYRESRRDHSLGLFWRTAAPVVALPAFILQSSRPPPWLFQDPFVSVYPVHEAFEQASVGGIPSTILFFKPSYRPPDVEPDYQRTDHQIYFQLVRPYIITLQTVGYTIDVPDFNDHPWIEWIHPKASDEAALYPFRQIPVNIRGHQFNLFFNQPPSPRLDPEPDRIRPFDMGLMALRNTKAVPQQLTTCGHIDVYDYGNGSILIAWGPFK